MKPIVCAGLLFAIAGARVFGDEEPAASEVTEAQRAADAAKPAAPTNRPHALPPALVSAALTAGTGALILSGVDWSEDNAPGEPTQEIPLQVKPSDGAQLVGPRLTFSWESVAGADTYLLDVDLCAAPDVCSDFRLDRTAALELTLDWPEGATAGRWRVRAVSADNVAGPWSAFRTFTVTLE